MTSQQTAVAFLSVTASGTRRPLRLTVELRNVSGYEITEGVGAWSCGETLAGSSLRLTCRAASSRTRLPFGLSAGVAVEGAAVTGTIRVDDGQATRRRQVSISS